MSNDFKIESMAIPDPTGPLGTRWVHQMAPVLADARRKLVDVMVVDDSQWNIAGTYKVSLIALQHLLNAAIGVKSPATPFMPILPANVTGMAAAAIRTYRTAGVTGTVDRTYVPPGFSGGVGSELPMDIDNATLSCAITVQPDAYYSDPSCDLIVPGKCSLMQPSDGDWYAEAIMLAANNAIIGGGSAGSDLKVTVTTQATNPGSPYAGTARGTISSSGLGLSSKANHTPVLASLGPFNWGSDAYWSAQFNSANASTRVRISAMGARRSGAPGFRVLPICEGGYRIDSLSGGSSWIGTHPNSFEWTKVACQGRKPRLIIGGLGENDFGNLITAAQWKTKLAGFLDKMTLEYPGVPVFWCCESMRGDTGTANYSTFMAERDQQAGVIAELANTYPQLFGGNWRRAAHEMGDVQKNTDTTGLTDLGDFETLVAAAGSVALTQNTHMVRSRVNGYLEMWKYTGATTTIGAAGVINDIRLGPAGTILIGAPVFDAPANVWRLLGRAFPHGPAPGGAPDYVHYGPKHQVEREQFVVRTITSAITIAADRTRKVWRWAGRRW